MKKPAFFFSFAFIILVSAFYFRINLPRATAGQSPVKPQQKNLPKPFFVTYHLAGVHLTNTKWPKGNDYGGLYDLKSNYSIRDGHGPDGCEYILTLKRGSSWGGDIEELREVFRGVRLKLVTGRGVEIGDMPQEVEKKIGKPTIVDIEYSRFVADGEIIESFPSYTYIYKGERYYRATYSFKNNKLTEIEFYDARMPSKQHSHGGCS